MAPPSIHFQRTFVLRNLECLENFEFLSRSFFFFASLLLVKNSAFLYLLCHASISFLAFNMFLLLPFHLCLKNPFTQIFVRFGKQLEENNE